MRTWRRRRNWNRVMKFTNYNTKPSSSGSPLPEVRQAALASVEKLAEAPAIRRKALRMLIQAHLTAGNGTKALTFARQ